MAQFYQTDPTSNEMPFDESEWMTPPATRPVPTTIRRLAPAPYTPAYVPQGPSVPANPTGVYEVSQREWEGMQNASAAAAPVGMMAAAGGPLGVAAMGVGTAASVFDAYQKYKAQKAQERMNKILMRRQTQAYNRDERLLAEADRQAAIDAIRNEAAVARSNLERYAQRGSRLSGV